MQIEKQKYACTDKISHKSRNAEKIKANKKEEVADIISSDIKFLFSERYKREISKILVSSITESIAEQDKACINTQALLSFIQKLIEKAVTKQDFYLSSEQYDSLKTIEKDTTLLKV